MGWATAVLIVYVYVEDVIGIAGFGEGLSESGWIQVCRIFVATLPAVTASCSSEWPWVAC
jgi:hypothetical protein